MKTQPHIIKRGKLIFLLYEDKVVVNYGLSQWTSYNQYYNWNRQGITKFRKKIEKSKESEYSTSAAVLTLANECDIIGSGTIQPKEVTL